MATDEYLERPRSQVDVEGLVHRAEEVLEKREASFRLSTAVSLNGNAQNPLFALGLAPEPKKGGGRLTAYRAHKPSSEGEMKWASSQQGSLRTAALAQAEARLCLAEVQFGPFMQDSGDVLFLVSFFAHTAFTGE